MAVKLGLGQAEMHREMSSQATPGKHLKLYISFTEVIAE